MAKNPNRPTLEQGFTLVELMIAMVLGLLVIAGVGSLYVSNKQTYTTSEDLSEYQENVRYIFEMMTKDIRQADGTPCRRKEYKFKPQSSISGLNWGDGIRGYTGNENAEAQDPTFGTGSADRVAGTDALRVTGSSGPIGEVTQHTPDSDVFIVDKSLTGSLLIVCDNYTVSAFKATTNGTKITSDSILDGDYSPPNARISGASQILWYLGCNDLADCASADGRSLYRAKNNLADSGGESPQPIANGIKNLQFEYLSRDATEYTETATYWPAVVAVRVSLELFPPGTKNDGTNQEGQLTPKLTHVIALRNRIDP